MSGIAYQPLNRARREIRLLNLDNSDETIEDGGMDGTPLRCQLVTTSLVLYNTKTHPELVNDPIMQLLLSRFPICLMLGYLLLKIVRSTRPLIAQGKPISYNALSYVWGDPECVCDIEVNGKVAKITKSLAEALQSIRSNTSIRVIWVDAICINQQDDGEKSWQVQEMAAIYKRAARVVSWLGPVTAQAELTLATLGNLKRTPSSTFIRLLDQWRPPNRLSSALKDATSILLEDFTRQNLAFCHSMVFRECCCSFGECRHETCQRP
jgi:hypothetical protein